MMEKKSARLAAIFASLLLITMAGSIILYRSIQPGSHAVGAPISKAVLLSNAIVPDYRLNKKDAVPAWQKPLRNDGIPGETRRDFRILAGLYNLSLVPTYDGSNQETHPKLLYFPNGWNGYRYWMSMTPYPGTDDDYENPSIVTSNDLKTWVVPKGLKNPITGVPADVKYGGHYSDSQLVMNNGTMELWYRANIGNRRTRMTDYRVDYYYRTMSTDGIHWSKPQPMQSSKNSILSLAVIHQQDRYQFWYRDRFSRLMYADSKDGTHWVDFRQCEIPLPRGYAPWHQDVVFCNDKYYLLQTAQDPKPRYAFSLFLSESADGIHFTRGTSFYPSDNPTILHKTWLYRSTFAPVENGMFQMVISYRLPGNKWFMTQCSLSQAAWNTACRTNRRVVLKAPPVKVSASSAPSSRIRRPAASSSHSAPRRSVSSRASSRAVPSAPSSRPKRPAASSSRSASSRPSSSRSASSGSVSSRVI